MKGTEDFNMVNFSIILILIFRNFSGIFYLFLSLSISKGKLIFRSRADVLQESFEKQATNMVLNTKILRNWNPWKKIVT